MHSSWILLIIAFFVIFLLITILSKSHQNSYKAKNLMTDNEFEFFNRLIKALPDYYVFPQVSFGAILEGNSKDYKEKQRLRLTFAQKMADYVIYNKQKKIVAIIELDDRTHDKAKDAKRDAMLISAGYKILRFESKKKPTITEIREFVGE